jgi:hypothetical protein
VAKSKPQKSDVGEKIFRVLPKQVGQTIAAAMRVWLPGQSWTQLRKLLESRQDYASAPSNLNFNTP